MSIGTYFKGNFGIFATDYEVESLYYIYDYAIYRAMRERRSIIIFCTSKEKAKVWNKIVGDYDFPAIVHLREVSKGLITLYRAGEFLQDGKHPQSVLIIDGAKDLLYGKQSMEDLSEEELREEYAKHGTVYSSIERMIECRAKTRYGDPTKILSLFDNCPANMIFLLAECNTNGLDCFKEEYPGLLSFGDSLLGIRKTGNTADSYILVNKKPKKLRSIRNEIKEYILDDADRLTANVMYL